MIRVHTPRRKKKFHINVLVFIHTYHGWEHSTVLSTNSLLTLNPLLFRFSTLYPPIIAWVTSESLIPKVPHPPCRCYCVLPVHGVTVRQGRLTEMYVMSVVQTVLILPDPVRHVSNGRFHFSATNCEFNHSETKVRVLDVEMINTLKPQNYFKHEIITKCGFRKGNLAVTVLSFLLYFLI